MGRVALLADDLGSRRAQAVSVIRRQSPLAISEILRRVGSHESLVELDMVGPDLERRAADFTSLVRDLIQLGARTEMLRLTDQEKLPEDYAAKRVRVDLDMLHRMIMSHQREEQYRERIESSLEDEEDGE